MWWTNSLCDSAEDLGTLAENVPPTESVRIRRVIIGILPCV